MRRTSGLRTRLLMLTGAGLLLIGAAGLGTGRVSLPIAPRDPMPRARRTTVAGRIVEGAKREVERGVRYDAGYVRISYPGGDLPADRGACTDVVIRALRNAGYDLQALMHQDMRRHFRLYPKRYGLRKPDPNIDHRRAGNHVVFLRRHALELPRSTTGAAAATWQPGDLVYWGQRDAPWHCGVLSDRRNAQGLPLVIHNVSGAREEDCLTFDDIAGHFRFPAGSRTR